MRFSSGGRATAAPLLLFHRRLDGGTHALHVRAAEKTEVESEQTRGREATPHPQTKWQPGDWRAAAWSSWTLSLLFLRDSPFKKRFTVVDAASKPTLKQLGYSMRARAEMCLLLARARRESACDRCALTAFCWELRGDCRLIDLVSSSSLDDTASLLAESDVLTWSISTAGPATSGREDRDGRRRRAHLGLASAVPCEPVVYIDTSRGVHPCISTRCLCQSTVRPRFSTNRRKGRRAGRS